MRSQCLESSCWFGRKTAQVHCQIPTRSTCRTAVGLFQLVKSTIMTVDRIGTVICQRRKGRQAKGLKALSLSFLLFTDIQELSCVCGSRQIKAGEPKQTRLICRCSNPRKTETKLQWHLRRQQAWSDLIGRRTISVVQKALRSTQNLTLIQ